MSVCVSVTSRYSVETTRLDGSSWFMTQSFAFTYLSLCYKEILVSPKIRIFTSSQTLDFKNFAAASRSCCQQNSSTVEFVDDIYDCRRVVALYYTSVSCNPQTLLLRFVVDLLYTCSYNMPQWTRFDRRSASRQQSFL